MSQYWRPTSPTIRTAPARSICQTRFIAPQFAGVDEYALLQARNSGLERSAARLASHGESGAPAGSGYTAPWMVHAALDQLILGEPSASYQLADADGYPDFRGLMTWSINWDVLTNNSFSQPHRDYLDSVFLHVDTPTISAASGGTAAFSLTAGRKNAGRNHLLLVGFTGTEPGTPLPGGATLPLNFDALTPAALDPALSSIFSGFVGTLDPDGEATAHLVVPPIPPLAGLPLTFAYTLDPWDFASTSVQVTLTP